jgi:hypothetical protein
MRLATANSTHNLNKCELLRSEEHGFKCSHCGSLWHWSGYLPGRARVGCPLFCTSQTNTQMSLFPEPHPLYLLGRWAPTWPPHHAALMTMQAPQWMRGPPRPPPGFCNRAAPTPQGRFAQVLPPAPSTPPGLHQPPRRHLAPQASFFVPPMMACGDDHLQLAVDVAERGLQDRDASDGGGEGRRGRAAALATPTPLRSRRSTPAPASAPAPVPAPAPRSRKPLLPTGWSLGWALGRDDRAADGANAKGASAACAPIGPGYVLQLAG